MAKIGMYPGSFDPITKGHMNILDKALKIFDKVVIAVVKNSAKNTFLTLQERTELIEEIYKDNSNVSCVGLDSRLSVDLAKDLGAIAIIRGLRAVSDFEYEFQIASINRSQSPEVESVFFTPDEKLTFISSSMVKEIAMYDGKIDSFVHPIVENYLAKKFSSSDS